MSRKPGNGGGAARTSPAGQKVRDPAPVDELKALLDLRMKQRREETRELNRRWRRICRGTARSPSRRYSD